jgi:hypothetical protein
MNLPRFTHPPVYDHTICEGYHALQYRTIYPEGRNLSDTGGGGRE